MDSSTPRFTNDVSCQFLKELDKPLYSAEACANWAEDVQQHVRRDDEFRQTHPAESIHRLACEGSRTRDGGVIREASTEMLITVQSGQKVRVARAGDCVEYPDGTSATILSDSEAQEPTIAVVGSRLSNGDEIIDTLQSLTFLVSREGLTLPPCLYTNED